MKIDYIIISSDDNPYYKDFYEIVAKKWWELGFKTYYINITDKNEIIETDLGIVHNIKKVKNVSTGFQSQVVRLYASKLIENANILMSDIDMLPINGKYFEQYSLILNTENVIIYSGQPYGNVPYYPMCYILSNSNNLRKILGIEKMDFSEYCNYLLENYGEKWNCDEHFLYEKLQIYKDKLVLYTRDFKTRIDRGNWRYNIDKLKLGYYVDSHLLRPLEENYEQITNLLKNAQKV